MCKDSNETRGTAADIRTAHPRAAARRLIALAAVTRLDEHAKTISQIRKALELAREQHERCSEELAATERLVEQTEDLIMHEAMAIAGLEDDGGDDEDCGGCGCEGDTAVANDARQLSFDDEEDERAQPSAAASAEPDRPRTGGVRPALAPLVFGALGVACAVASLVTRSLTDERKE
jgi:hypothetical protein